MAESYYLDVAFLVNFLMDYLLLFLTGMARGLQKSRGAFVLAAAVGAVCACIAEVLQFGAGSSLVLLFVCAGMMCRIAFGRRSVLWKNCLVLLFLTFVFGGVMESAGMVLTQRNSRLPAAWQPATIWLSIGSTGLAALFLWLRRFNREEGKCLIYPVRLQLFGQEFCCQGLLDTGNCLYEPFGNKPVILLADETLCDALMDGLKQHPEKTRFVPFRSVGKEGMLAGTELGEIHIQTEKEEKKRQGVVAVCTDYVPKGTGYQIILHPDLFSGMW